MSIRTEEILPPAGDPSRSELAQLRKATGTLTGTVFFGTLLRTMRNSAMKGPIGHGGRGEEIFAGQLHGVLAERIGSSTQSNLGDIVFKHLERQQRAISDARVAQEDRKV